MPTICSCIVGSALFGKVVMLTGSAAVIAKSTTILSIWSSSNAASALARPATDLPTIQTALIGITGKRITRNRNAVAISGSATDAPALFPLRVGRAEYRYGLAPACDAAVLGQGRPWSGVVARGWSRSVTTVPTHLSRGSDHWLDQESVGLDAIKHYPASGRGFCASRPEPESLSREL